MSEGEFMMFHCPSQMLRCVNVYCVPANASPYRCDVQLEANSHRVAVSLV